LKGTVGAELLKVHVSYGPLVQSLLAKFNRGPKSAAKIKGIAHITGGGFIDNLPRVLPKNCDAVVRKGSWAQLPIFDILRAEGGVPEEELYQVFNMGIGMTLAVEKKSAAAILAACSRAGHPAWIIGEIVRGSGETRMV
jgi:phosphoribosylformylglycinamidine cyclo-ligase